MTQGTPQRARVGEVITTRRKELGLSQEQMARRIGLTLAGYRPHEYGQRDLGSEDLPRWAEALELTQVELAVRLGLADLNFRSIYASEIAGLVDQVDDPEVAAELMTAVRALFRVGRLHRAPEERN